MSLRAILSGRHHPYAVEVTENIRLACREKGVSYIRVVRKEDEASRHEAQVFLVPGVEEAAEFLKETDGVVLLTTGSKELEKYTVLPDYQSRCYARVLPTPEVLEKCRELGFEGSHIIAMQGPFPRSSIMPS